MINRNILSTAAQNALPSGVRRMFELAKRYDDSINLTLGEPGFTAPEHIIEAGIRGLKDKKTKYTPNAGIKELRDAIAWKLQKENGIKCDPDRNIIVTAGATQALMLAMVTLVNPGDEVIIHPFDASKVEDPSLIIYAPVRVLGNKTIVTNGDQTDTIWEYLARGESWEAALRTRMFEDDGPNWTPRISGLLAGDGSYKMSILKAADAEGTACARFFYEYPAIAGLGHFIHTYVCDGNPVIPTFQGEPERVAIDGDIDNFTNMLWENLNEANKISLFVRYTDLATGEKEQRIINKHC